MEHNVAIPYLTLTTPRLVLRPWQRPDLDAMAAWPRFPDPLDDAWHWASRLHEQSAADLFFLGRALDAARREWTITTTAGVIVGHLGIRGINHDSSTARLGIGFGWPYVGQGYGKEALTTFLDAFFGAMRFTQMWLDVSEHNVRAQRLYNRLGFRAVRSFWFESGPATDFAFLDAPQYAPIKHHFRIHEHMLFVRSTEMMLDHDSWRATRQRDS